MQDHQQVIPKANWWSSSTRSNILVEAYQWLRVIKAMVALAVVVLVVLDPTTSPGPGAPWTGGDGGVGLQAPTTFQKSRFNNWNSWSKSRWLLFCWWWWLVVYAPVMDLILDRVGSGWTIWWCRKWWTWWTTITLR